jgi:hypothetical protein
MRWPLSVQNSAPPALARNCRRPSGGTGMTASYFVTVSDRFIIGWIVHSKW